MFAAEILLPLDFFSLDVISTTLCSHRYLAVIFPITPIIHATLLLPGNIRLSFGSRTQLLANDILRDSTGKETSCSGSVTCFDLRLTHRANSTKIPASEDRFANALPVVV